MTGKSIFGDVLGNSIAGNGRNWVGPAKPVVAPVSGSSGRNWLLDDIPDLPSDVYRVPGRPEADVDYGFSGDDAAYTRQRFGQAAAAQSDARKQELEVARVVAGNRQREAAFANTLGDRILNTPLGDLPSQIRQGVAGLTKSGIAHLQDMVAPVATLSAAAPFLSSRPRYEGSENLANYWMRSNPGDISTSENARAVRAGAFEHQVAQNLADVGAMTVTSPYQSGRLIGEGVGQVQGGDYLPGAANIGLGALGAIPVAPYAASATRRVVGEFADSVSGMAKQLRASGVPDWTIRMRQYQPGVLHSNPSPFELERVGASVSNSASTYGKNPSSFTSETTWTAPSKGTGIKYKVYQQNIDWNLEVKGVTNLERAKAGGAPYIMKDGLPQQLQLHHSRQNGQGPLFELSRSTHLVTKSGQGREALHPYGRQQHPDFPVNRPLFTKDVQQYWINRVIGEQP